MSKRERQAAREILMQMLFQMEIQYDFSEAAQAAFLELYPPDETETAYVHAVCETISDYIDRIDRLIESSSENWKLSRIAKVDLAILRLATAEIVYMDDIPDSVSANEAVLLAKTFGGEESSKFINGILGRLIRHARSAEA